MFHGLYCFQRPFELIGRDGIARNVTLEPGDFVMYESHNIIHGHPFPLHGRFMANIFVHFEPIGYLSDPIDFRRKVPLYIDPDSPEAKSFEKEHPDGHAYNVMEQTQYGGNKAHFQASIGDVQQLSKLLERSGYLIHGRDENRWTPLAAAVYKGNAEAVRLLLDLGSDHHALLGEHGNHGSILHLAKKQHGNDHPIVQMLVERGAREVEPLDSEDEL